MILAITGLALGSGPVAPRNGPDKALIQKARDILKDVPLIDGHNDTPWQYRDQVNNHLDAIDFSKSTAHLDPPMQTDIPRRWRDKPRLLRDKQAGDVDAGGDLPDAELIEMIEDV